MLNPKHNFANMTEATDNSILMSPTTQNETMFSDNQNESMREEIKSATPNMIHNCKVPKISARLIKSLKIPETNEAVKLQNKLRSMPGYVPKLGNGSMGIISPKLMNMS